MTEALRPSLETALGFTCRGASKRLAPRRMKWGHTSRPCLVQAVVIPRPHLWAFSWYSIVTPSTDRSCFSTFVPGS